MYMYSYYVSMMIIGIRLSVYLRSSANCKVVPTIRPFLFMAVNMSSKKDLFFFSPEICRGDLRFFCFCLLFRLLLYI